MVFISSLFRYDSVPSGFMTGWPSAQLIGHQVNTLQPPQLPPKNVPLMSPPSASTARAAASNSARVVGGFSGSRPAWRKSSLLYIHTDRSTTNGRPYCLPSQVEASICAGAIRSLKGRLAILSVRSVNRPCEVQLGMNTTSAENRSGSEFEPAAAPTLAW